MHPVILLIAAFFCATQAHAVTSAGKQDQTKAAASKANREATPAPKDAKKTETAAMCPGDELPLGTLTGDDAKGLAKTLNSLFPEFSVVASPDKGAETSSLCVASREKSKKPNKCEPSTQTFQSRCALNAIVRLTDRDAYIGAGLNSSFVIVPQSIPGPELARLFPYPASDFELRHAYGNYIVLALLGGGSSSGLAKKAAGIKRDLELLDDLYGRAISNVQLAREMGASVEASGNSEPTDTDFGQAQQKAEQWLAQHTVRLSVLDPRDIALALSSLSSDWTFQVRSFGNAVTILPARSPSIRTYGAYIAADAIERDTIYRRRVADSQAAAETSSDGGGDNKTTTPGTTITSHTSTTTSQAAQTGKTPGVPVTTIVDSVTTTSQLSSPPTTAASSGDQLAAPSKSGGEPSLGASPASGQTPPANPSTAGSATAGGSPPASQKSREQGAPTAGKGKSDGGAGGPSAKASPPQQPQRFANVVRLYHLRQAKQIADAINAASPDGKPLVQSLDDNGNNDLLLILPSPLGGPDQGTQIRRAVALLDLPRPQLSLQVWSYQISAEENSDDPQSARGSKSVQDAFEKLRSAVSDANREMTRALQDGLGQIFDDENDARKRDKEDSIFDSTLKHYLTGRYDDCVAQDSYCLGYKDALAVPAGSDRAVNGSLSRLLLYLIAVSDGDAADLTKNVIDAMQPESCGAAPGSQQHEPVLCFKQFSAQLKVALQPRNLHVLRAALLDFLFEYKWTYVYPNDFVPYDLQRTAHLLDSLLGPIIDAFNEDLDDYVNCKLRQIERNLRQAVESETDYEKAGLVTQGMVQVATLSGSQASVDAKVNNYFDITPPLSLNDILNTGNQQNLANNLKSILEPKEILLLQALANIGSQPRITAELTKEAKLSITPTTLDTASSAQLDVEFDVSEPSPPTTVNQTSSQKDLLDRVADHHVTTHVRVESLKLFQVSAFTMELTHPQRPWPLPVLGWGWQAIFGSTPGLNKVFMIPRPPRTVDNRSVAIVRAVVVPTAMDLGLSLPFIGDRVYDPISDATDPINSVAQGGGRLRPFHKELMRCVQNGRNDCLDANASTRVRLSSEREDLRDPTSP